MPPSTDVPTALLRQYRAALEMLRQAIQACPESLWVDPRYPNRFWHVAYHAVFYAHLYLHPSPDRFQPWPRHRPKDQFLDPTPAEPISRPDVLEYLDLCLAELEPRLRELDLDAPSGFHWLPFSRLEAHLYSIRHLQHHTGQLIDRLRTVQETGIGWVVGR